MSDENTRSRARGGKAQVSPEVAQVNALDKHKRETLNSLVSQQVIHNLGKPSDLLSVQVRPLWGTIYRVNVFVGINLACARISDSFFLATDDDGNIIESSPSIKRLY